MSQIGVSSNRIYVAVMLSTATLLTLYISTVVPEFLRLFLIMLSGVFVAGIMSEEETGLAIGSFIACSVIGLFIVGSLDAIAPYFLFFGWYGIIKIPLDSMADKIVRFALKLLIYNAVIGFLFFVSPAYLIAFGSMHIAFVVVILEVGFILFDVLLYLFGELYDSVFKRFLS